MASARRVQPLARGGLGLRVPGPHLRGADALARRPRRPRSPSSTRCSSAARASCTSGPRPCPAANGDEPLARRPRCTTRCGPASPRRRSRSRSTSATAATTRFAGAWGGSDDVRGLRQDRRRSARSLVVRPRHPRHDRRRSSSHGVFTRHPTLRVASIENGSDWVHAAREAAAQAGEPDAVGVRGGPARHDPPARVGHAVLRGGPAQARRPHRRRAHPVRLRLAPRRRRSPSRSTS